jgi:hypothetical protein
VAKLSWNKFIETYNKRYCFASSVSSRLPHGPHFDKNGKKLPTPYALFQEWLSINITGDYSTTQIKRGFLVSVINLKDAELLKNTFQLMGGPIEYEGNKNTFLLDYRDATYSSVAKALGYELKYA